MQRAPGREYTGVFGELKHLETHIEAATRIFAENTNMHFHRWHKKASLQLPNAEANLTVFVGESDLLENVVTGNKCVVMVKSLDQLTQSGDLDNTTKWVLLMCMDTAQSIDAAQVAYEGIHPQLDGEQITPDLSKGLKIGVVCNSYTDFNNLVEKLRQDPANKDNRFFCVLSTTQLYGQAFDFYFEHAPGQQLCTVAKYAVEVMQIRGMKQSAPLFTQFIQPSL